MLVCFNSTKTSLQGNWRNWADSEEGESVQQAKNGPDIGRRKKNKTEITGSVKGSKV